MNNQLRSIIHSYLNAGLCALPATSEKKCPVGSWKQFQERRPSAEEIDAMLNQHPEANAIAIICGAVSGNLEVIDFDWGGKSLEDWGEEVLQNGGDYEGLPIEETQSHGFHIFYRSTEPVDKNTKLTWYNFSDEELVDNNGKKTYHGKEVLPGKDGNYGACTIETRGEGGLVIVAPSKGYKINKGSWLEVPVISGARARALKQAALNISTAVLEAPKPKPVVNRETLRGIDGRFSSANYLREKGLSATILASHGWSFVGFYGGDSDAELWRRPGKSHGVSALRHVSEGQVHVWTSSVYNLEAGRTYSPLALLAALDYNNDEKAASQAVFEVAKQNNELPEVKTTDYMTTSFINQAVAPLQEASAEQTELAIKAEKDSFDDKLPRLPKSIKKYLNETSNFIGPFMRQMAWIARFEQPELSFCSAMATLSFMTSGHVNARRTVHPNVNMYMLSDSGTGKTGNLDHAEACAYHFLGEGNNGTICGGVESVPAAYNLYKEHGPLMFWLQDEFHTYLDTVVKHGEGTRAQVMKDIITKILGNPLRELRCGPSVKNRERRNKNEQGPIDERFVCNMTMLVGSQTGSATKFLSNSETAVSGTIARFLFCAGKSLKQLRSEGYMWQSPRASFSTLSEAEKQYIGGWQAFQLKFANQESKKIADESEFADDFNSFADNTAPADESDKFVYDLYDGYCVPTVVENYEERMDKWSCDTIGPLLDSVEEKFGANSGSITFLTRLRQYAEIFQLLIACDKWHSQDSLESLVIDEEAFQIGLELASFFAEANIKLINSDKAQETFEDTAMKKKYQRLLSKCTLKDGRFIISGNLFCQVFRKPSVRDEVLNALRNLNALDQLESNASGKGRKGILYAIDETALRTLCR